MGNRGPRAAAVAAAAQPAAAVQQQAQRRWVSPTYQCEMLKEQENPNSFKNWKEGILNWFTCGGMNSHQ